MTPQEFKLDMDRLLEFHCQMAAEISRTGGEGAKELLALGQELICQLRLAYDGIQFAAPGGIQREAFQRFYHEQVSQLYLLHERMFDQMGLFEVSDPRVNELVYPLADIMTPLRKAWPDPEGRW